MASLSPKQRSIAQALADGQRPKDIARDLNVTAATVRTHIHRATKTAHATSTSALVAKLLRDGEIK